jgi:hypothetical protein
MTKLNDLVDRYISVWNEPEPDRRREGIAALWEEDGAHFTPSLEARGTRPSRPGWPAPMRSG